MLIDKRLKNLGKNICAIREKKKITQSHLADISGLKQTYISRLENGSINITYSNLLVICDALEISPMHIV